MDSFFLQSALVLENVTKITYFDFYIFHSKDILTLNYQSVSQINAKIL